MLYPVKCPRGVYTPYPFECPIGIAFYKKYVAGGYVGGGRGGSIFVSPVTSRSGTHIWRVCGGGGGGGGGKREGGGVPYLSHLL